MKKITFLIAVLICAFQTSAQNDLWSEPINTGLNSTYLVQNVTFDGNALIYGEIGAFYSKNDSLYCGGSSVWSGQQTSIAVMADDTTTPEKDGFNTGDTIIWLATNDNGYTTYEASVTYIVDFMGNIGSSVYTTNSINVISPFEISTIEYCVNDADEDGVCDEDETYGCTDPNAFNYNPSATDNDGSCEDVMEGCTNDDADNYDQSANTDDGTCIISGCTNIEAQNYDENANSDNGTCIIVGCTNQNAFNFNPSATSDNNSCLTEINLEYDTVPTSIPVSFIILENSISLTLGNSVISSEDIIGAFQIVNGALNCVGYTPWGDGEVSIALWEDESSTIEIDGYVVGEPLYWVANQNSTGVNYLLEVTINELNIITEITLNTDVNLGCTDENALNYTSTVGVIEDGSCIYAVQGCTDENACGFDADANTDDGSCYTLTLEISISDINTLTVNVESTNTEDVLTDPTYTWYLDGNVTGGVINGTIFQAGEYSLTVTDDLGCEQTSSTLQANLSTNDVINNNIVIFPNPVNSVINISSNNIDIHSFDLYNTIGELMYTKSKLNSKVITINRNELNSGIYISKITDANGNIFVRNIILE